jgi:hypothetical protein
MLDTLRMFFRPMASFFIIFSIVWMAYVFVFFAMYNDSMYGASSFLKAIETTYLMILHKFNSQDMVANQPILGPIVFLSYMIIVVTIMANFMVVIILKGFEQVKNDYRTRHGGEKAVLWEFLETHVSRLTQSTRKHLAKSKNKKKQVTEVKSEDNLMLFKQKTDDFVGYVSRCRKGEVVVEEEFVKTGFVRRLRTKLGWKKNSVGTV